MANEKLFYEKNVLTFLQHEKSFSWVLGFLLNSSRIVLALCNDWVVFTGLRRYAYKIVKFRTMQQEVFVMNVQDFCEFIIKQDITMFWFSHLYSNCYSYFANSPWRFSCFLTDWKMAMAMVKNFSSLSH